MNNSQGKLYIVSTPIGNLEDITFRAINTLKEVDLIASEDTRQTRKLLSHFSISKPLTSYYSYNERGKAEALIEKIKNGTNLALVSDAGTPGISDPSYCIISLAIENSIDIIPIPGASAILPALIASGLPIARFHFEGFLPRKKGKREERLKRFIDNDISFVVYESPYRVKATLLDIYNLLGNRKIALAREITKIYEEILRGDILEVLSKIEKRAKLGEITIVVGGAAEESVQRSD